MNVDTDEGWKAGRGKVARWPFDSSRMARLRRALVVSGHAARVRYWFPHIPLAAALAWAGFLLLWIIFSLQRTVLLSDFPKHIVDFPPSSMPFVLSGVAMLIMSVGLVLRSRFAWIIAIVLTACLVLSAAIHGHWHHTSFVYYDGILLLALLFSYRWFRRSSLAAGTLFAVASALLLLIYAVFGSLYLGDQFSPPIKDLVTAFYYSVVTMATVGYGDIVPKGTEARLFTASAIILGLAVFATSVTAIAAPLITRLTTRKEKRVKRSGHFIVIGATPLAYNTYREFKKRGQEVVFILPKAPETGDIDPGDLIIGDANALETLRKAHADQAQAVLAMRMDDSDNAFIVLAIRELKGRAKTIVAINDSKHMERIKLVQPDMVIAPEVLGGELLAMMLSGEPITGDFVMQRFLHSPAPRKLLLPEHWRFEIPAEPRTNLAANPRWNHKISYRLPFTGTEVPWMTVASSLHKNRITRAILGLRPFCEFRLRHARWNRLWGIGKNVGSCHGRRGIYPIVSLTIARGASCGNVEELTWRVVNR